MMLRSSSTPILGSLLSSHCDSPSNHHNSETNPSKQRYSPISFHHQYYSHNKKFGSVHLTNSCQSPISPSIADLPAQEFGSNGLRRAQSDGNLEGLLDPSASFDGFDEFSNNSYHLHPLPKKFSHKQNYTMLESIPSFTVRGSLHLSEGDEESSDDDEEEEGKEAGEKVEAMLKNVDLGLEKSYAYANRVAESDRVLSKMHMAMGLGVSDFTGFIGGNFGGAGGNGNGGGNEGNRRGSNDGDDGGAMEEYYKKMIEENPGDPIFLRNYAEFLYLMKNDLKGAEEYYSRAILADPKDGEVLSQYAKVIWSLHHDHARAASYFERAVQAAPEDSLVLAAHANFLWETEEDDDMIEGGAMEENLKKEAPLVYQNAA